MRRLIGSIALLTIMAAVAPPASAQMGPPNKRPQVATPEQLERKRQADELDRRYKATLKKTDPDAPIKADPWATMRAPGDGKK